jgi:hypothetical protein
LFEMCNYFDAAPGDSAFGQSECQNATLLSDAEGSFRKDAAAHHYEWNNYPIFGTNIHGR